MTKPIFALAVAVAGLSAGQGVNLDVKLGLWEATSVSQTSGRPAIDTSKMTPELKQRVEDAMKAREAKGPATHTSRECITKEKLEKDMLFNSEGLQASCKRTIVTNTRSVTEVKMDCPNEKMAGSGTFRFEALSRENVKGTYNFNSGSMNASGTMTAKWISASCGDTK